MDYTRRLVDLPTGWTEWMIYGPNGAVVAGPIASDHDAKWILSRYNDRPSA